jgi:hypothetical protein
MPYLLRAKNLESVIYCSQTFVWRSPRRVAAWYANLRDCTLPSERSVRLGPAGTSVWRVARPSSTRSLQAARALASRPRSDKHVLADETLGTAHGDFESGCVRGFPEMPVTCTRSGGTATPAIHIADPGNNATNAARVGKSGGPSPTSSFLKTKLF